MDNFNLKQYLFESRVGMYSRARLDENALLDAETLGKEIAKQHPEIIRYHHDGDTRRFQDAIFKYAGEILRDAGIPLQTVRGLAYDADWAMDLVSGTKSALEYEGLEEVEDDKMSVSDEEFERYLEHELREAKVDLDEPAYYITGWGRGFDDINRAKKASYIIDEIIDTLYDEDSNEADLQTMILNDPEECSGFYDPKFKPIIDREQLVPKIQLEDAENEVAWEIWQKASFPNKVPGTDFSLNETNPAALGVPQDMADRRFDKEEDQDNIAYRDDAEIAEAIGVIPSVDKVKPAETGLDKYLDLVHGHDWFHHFADDPRAWTKGQAEKAEMKALYSQLNPAEKQKAMDAFIDKYLEIHDPKQFPNAANNVKYLTTDTFKGSI